MWIDDQELSQSAPQETGQKFLRFTLGPQDTALIQVDAVAEVLRIGLSEVLPVPRTPPDRVGIYNWRGKVLWLVELAHFVGLAPVFWSGNSSTAATVIVLHVCDRHLGLLVSQVSDIEWHDLQHLQPPSAGLFSARLLPFLQGYLAASGSAVIDAQAIAQAVLRTAHL